jgi:hypothetical protein
LLLFASFNRKNCFPDQESISIIIAEELQLFTAYLGNSYDSREIINVLPCYRIRTPLWRQRFALSLFLLTQQTMHGVFFELICILNITLNSPVETPTTLALDIPEACTGTVSTGRHATPQAMTAEFRDVIQTRCSRAFSQYFIHAVRMQSLFADMLPLIYPPEDCTGINTRNAKPSFQRRRRTTTAIAIRNCFYDSLPA